MANPPGELNPVERAEEHLLHRREIAGVQENLIDLDEREVDGIVTGLRDRTPVSLDGVDTSVIKRVDSGFDDEAFRAIARETFEKVRQPERCRIRKSQPSCSARTCRSRCKTTSLEMLPHIVTISCPFSGSVTR